MRLEGSSLAVLYVLSIVDGHWEASFLALSVQIVRCHIRTKVGPDPNVIVRQTDDELEG